MDGHRRGSLERPYQGCKREACYQGLRSIALSFGSPLACFARRQNQTLGGLGLVNLGHIMRLNQRVRLMELPAIDLCAVGIDIVNLGLAFGLVLGESVLVGEVEVFR